MKFLKVFFWEADVLAFFAAVHSVSLTDVNEFIKMIVNIAFFFYVLYRIRVKAQQELKNDLDIEDLIRKKRKKMKISKHFWLEEFNISGGTIPDHVRMRIINLHAIPMDAVREELGTKVWPSLKSGYRPVWWEKQHKRSGKSQHTYEGKGANDWTCTNFKKNKDKFLELILKHTKYTRLAVYSGFIHCDYKETQSGKRQIFSSTKDSVWTLEKEIDF